MSMIPTVVANVTRLVAWSATLLMALASFAPARADDLVRGESGCGLICLVFSGPKSEAADPQPAATPVRYPSFVPSEEEYDAPPRSRIRSPRRARRQPSGERAVAVRPDAVQPDKARPVPAVASAPASPAPQLTQEERRKAAMASEEALSVRVGERARRALQSMCSGCLVRLPPSEATAVGRRVEPGAPAEPVRRAP